MRKQLTRVRIQIQKKPLTALLILGFSIWLLWTLWATYRANNTGFDTKTLWDWMELLIIPTVLAIGVWWLNRNEKRVELEIANERIQTERKIAFEQLQEATIQAYLDRMTNLLLEANLRASTDDDEVRSIARSRTLTVLRSLDTTRKGALLRFLYESDLISNEKKVVYLKGADLNQCDLIKANLRWANLSWASLKAAKLTRALLNGADLTGALLSSADLEDAKLPGATLRLAILLEAKLTNADLSSANLQDANLEGAILQLTHLGKANLRAANLSSCDLSQADLTEANLTRADLSDSRLNGVNFTNANLTGAILKNADLTEANLSGADLSLADLTGAKIDNQQLEQAKSLVVAIMPNGHPYEAKS